MMEDRIAGKPKRGKDRVIIITLLILILALLLVMISPLFGNATNRGHLSGTVSPVGYATVTLKNNQSMATPTNFDQLLKVDWADYQNYLADDVSNVRFYSSPSVANSTELYAWMETNDSLVSDSSNVWVKLSGLTVPGDGTLSIYMLFFPKSISWGPHWGLAPTLTKPYGEYDNGANVFEAYFNGATPLSDFSSNSNLQSFGDVANQDIFGNNGNAIFASGSTNTRLTAFVYKERAFNANIPQKIEGVFEPSTWNLAGIDALNSDSATSTSVNGIGVQADDQGQFGTNYEALGNWTGDYYPGGVSTQYYYASVTSEPNNFTGAIGSESFYGPYLDDQTEDVNPFYGSGQGYLGTFFADANGSPISVDIELMRARAAPPNNVMPASTVSPFTSSETEPVNAASNVGSHSVSLSQDLVWSFIGQGENINVACMKGATSTVESGMINSAIDMNGASSYLSEMSVYRTVQNLALFEKNIIIHTI